MTGRRIVEQNGNNRRSIWMFITSMLIFGSINGLKAQSAAILSYIDPVAALLFSAVFLKEPLSLSARIE